MKAEIKQVISWLLTIFFALCIIYECVNIFSWGNGSAGNIIFLIISFILTFVFSTIAKIESRK